MLRRWRGAQPGPAPGRLGARDFFEAAEGDGPRGAGEAGLCRQQTLQALCGDCHSEKTLRESAQPGPVLRTFAPKKRAVGDELSGLEFAGFSGQKTDFGAR